MTLTGLGPAERVQVTDATPGLLPLLGVSPVLGRAFSADDAGLPMVLVSHTFWRTTLAADPRFVGRDLVLGGRPHTVVGVLPEGFVFAISGADIWRPLAFSASQSTTDGVRVAVIARLTGPTTPSVLAGVLDTVSRASAPPARVVTTSVATAIAGDRTTTLTPLAGARRRR